MSLTTRVLPPEEWERLAETDAGQLALVLNQETATVIGVERDGVLVGCAAVYPALHVDGLWIAETERKRTSIARRLWAAIRGEMTRRGTRGAVAGAVSDEMRGVLEKIGVALPGVQFVIRGRESWHQQ